MDSDKTRIIRPSSGQPTPTSTIGGDDDLTRILTRVSTVTDISLNPQVDESLGGSTNLDPSQTKLVRRSSSTSTATGKSQGPGSSMDDPVVAWLVVVKGPGKGSMICLGEQDNRIGRGGVGETPRVCLNFGDEGISRTNAFVIRYDPKKRRFKILPGESANIVYLNDEDLDSPMALNLGDIIEVSKTKLRFVPFCGENFDWEDVEN
jgi:hypothetical protein